MKIHYPNSWYVERLYDTDGKWRPELGSVGNKSYATGYLNALDTFYPHPPYRLINAKGEVAGERHERRAPNLNTKLNTQSPATGAGATPVAGGESAPPASTTCDQCGKRTILWYRKFDMDLCAVCAPKVAAAIHRQAVKKRGGFPR